MASYQVLPAVESGGGAFGEAIGEGLSSYATVSRKRKKKEEKEAKQEERRSAYSQVAKKSGMELSGLTYDEEGKAKYSYKKKEDPKDDILKDPAKTIKKAMLGIGDLEPVGEAFDIARPTPMAPKVAESEFPIASLTGQTPSATGGPMDYGQVVQQALKSRFAPGVDQSVISRDFLGLPQEPAPKTPKADVPPEFTADVQALKKIAQESSEEDADPESIFYQSMQKLSMKYLNDPLVLNRIKLILQTLDQ